MTTIAQQDPWKPYDAAKKPVVPEPAVFGLALIALMMILVLLHKANRRPL